MALYISWLFGGSDGYTPESRGVHYLIAVRGATRKLMVIVIRIPLKEKQN